MAEADLERSLGGGRSCLELVTVRTLEELCARRLDLCEVVRRWSM